MLNYCSSATLLLCRRSEHLSDQAVIIAAAKVYAIALHELKLAHPQLNNLPYGPPRVTFEQFRHNALRQIPRNDKDRKFFERLTGFRP
jgi:hypothetical protein